MCGMIVPDYTIRCITYGKGGFDPEKFLPVSSRAWPWVKPERGGIWSSPVASQYGWRHWCDAEDYGNRDLVDWFTFDFHGTAIVIDSVSDLDDLPWVNIESMYGILWEPLSFCGIDAIHLTENGERVTRFSKPRDLYGWDCETVFVMNPESISVLECVDG